MRHLKLYQAGVAGVIVLCLGVHSGSAEQPPATALGDADRQPTQKEAPMTLSIQDNMDVGMEYTLTSEGTVVDSTEGKEAFHYIHGRRQIIPGLERQLVGLHVGDSKEVTVKPEEGYGQVDHTAFIEVPKDQLPKDVVPTVGMFLRGVNPDGQNFRARVSEVKEKSVILDLNHPLAGKTLTFKIKITNLVPAPRS